MDSVIGFISHTHLSLSCTQRALMLTVLAPACFKPGVRGRDRRRQRNPKQFPASSPHLSECMKHSRKAAFRSGDAPDQLWRAHICTQPARSQRYAASSDTANPSESEMTTADIISHLSSHPGCMLKCHPGALYLKHASDCL